MNEKRKRQHSTVDRVDGQKCGDVTQDDIVSVKQELEAQMNVMKAELQNQMVQSTQDLKNQMQAHLQTQMQQMQTAVLDTMKQQFASMSAAMPAATPLASRRCPGDVMGPPYGMDASPMMSGGGDLRAAWERQIISPSKYITIASMNVSSLSARLHQILAQDCDIVACQEVRAAEHQMKYMQKELEHLNFSVIHGSLPSMKVTKGRVMTDKAHPGVAMIARHGLCMVPVPCPTDLQRWYDAGRLQLSEIGTPYGRVLLINTYFPVDKDMRTEMVGDMLTMLPPRTSGMSILTADLNDSIELGVLPTEMRAAGWVCPQQQIGQMGTYAHDCIHATSAIDGIWCCPHLRDRVSFTAIREVSGMQQQHRMIIVQILSEFEDDLMMEWIPTGPLPEKVHSEDTSACVWMQSADAYTKCINEGEVNAAWETWCEITVKTMGGDTRVCRRGRPPRFHPSQAQALTSKVAMLEKRYASEGPSEEIAIQIEKTRKELQRRSLKMWKSKLMASDVSTSREFFGWLHGPPRTPANVVLDEGGRECIGRPRCLQALHRYWSGIYQHGQQRPPLFAQAQEGVHLDAEDLDMLHYIVKSTSVARATGLDSWRCTEWKHFLGLRWTTSCFCFASFYRKGVVLMLGLTSRWLCFKRMRIRSPRLRSSVPLPSAVFPTMHSAGSWL